MLRTSWAAATVGALLITSIPGSASAERAQIRVDGDNFAESGVKIASHGCIDPTAVPEVQPVLVIAGKPDFPPPMGDRSTGWIPQRGGYAVGPTAHVDRPSELEKLTVRLYAPSTRVQGVAVAKYEDPNGRGTWRGVSPMVEHNQNGWHTVDATAYDYTWRLYSPQGSEIATVAGTGIQEFVTDQGGDSTGADIGIAFGCDSNTFYIDAFKVGAAGDVTVYDFEGYGTRSSLSVSKRLLTYGEKVKVTAGLRMITGSAPRAGTLLLEARKAGTKKFRRVTKLRTGSDGNSSVRLLPSKNMSYRTRFLGSKDVQGSASRIVKIKVRPNTRAKLRDAVVVQGNTFTISGRFVPKRSTKIMLQKYVRQEWRTQKTGRSRKDGTFTIGQRTTRVGKSYWRIKVAAGGGNTWGKTLAMKLVTKPKPKPPPSPGNPTPPPPTDPTPPPTEPPPPPPPPGPQRAWAH